MGIYICIDDTDNLESIGTGEVAERIGVAVHDRLGLASTMVTRHQLLIHEDIPYTSHNSSMCFELPGGKACHVGAVIRIAEETIVESMAPGSDPGLCVVCDPDNTTRKKLSDFGKTAKEKVVSKEAAYRLAKELNIHLSEHGGTGDGIIGSMAGVGLRLSGNDGEVKGGLKNIETGVFRAEEFLQRLDIDRIVEVSSGRCIQEGSIQFRKRSKSVLRDGCFTLLVEEADHGYVAIGKRHIRQMEISGSGNPIGEKGKLDCHKFEADVPEEQLDNSKRCSNCRHRRWKQDGFECTIGL